MSFTELLENLETLTPEQRQAIADRIDEIDDVDISPEIKALLEKRWTEYMVDPSKALNLDQFNTEVDRLLK